MGNVLQLNIHQTSNAGEIGDVSQLYKGEHDKKIPFDIVEIKNGSQWFVVTYANDIKYNLSFSPAH